MMFDEVDPEEDEEVTEDNLVLFFSSPAGAAVSVMQRNLHWGALAAARHFVTDHFNQSNLRSLSLEKHIIYFADFPASTTSKNPSESSSALTVALSGPIEDAVGHKLSRLCRWLRFVHGSFSQIKARVAAENGGTSCTRKSLAEKMSSIGTALVEGLARAAIPTCSSAFCGDALGASQTFETLPLYCTPSPRLFVAASQLAGQVRELGGGDKNLAVCVVAFGGSAVLFTEMDNQTTDCVLFIIRGGCQQQSSSVVTSTSLLSSTPSSVCHAVWVHPSLLHPSEQQQSSSKSSQNTQETEVVQAGLYLQTVNNVTMAVLMTAAVVDDTKHTKSILSLAQPSLQEIDCLIGSSVDEKSEFLNTSSAGGSLSASTSSSPNPLALSASGGAMMLMTPNSDSSLSGQQTKAQWLLNDSLTGTIKATPTPVDQAASFKSLLGVAHDTLSAADSKEDNKDPKEGEEMEKEQVSQVFLRRSNGAILSRRLFAKELHWYSHGSFSTVPHERFAKFVETTRNNTFTDKPDGQLW